MKFGGTSVAGTDRMLHVASVVKKYALQTRVVLIVSAMAGVTDRLLEAVTLLKRGELRQALERLQALEDDHLKVLEEMNVVAVRRLLAHNQIKQLMEKTKKYAAAHVFETVGQEQSDFIATFGERLSCVLLAEALSKQGIPAQAVDSSQVIVCSNRFGNAMALLKSTRKRAQKVLFRLMQNGLTPVVTGFYGATRKGKIATLGRGGSDYSASVLANVCDAQELIVWKEVDGVYTADPKKYQNAKFLAEISYEEAAILARQGAKVLHPETMEPAREKNITIWVKNTFKPEFKGTKIY